MKKQILLIVFILGLLSNSFAQNNNFESEAIFLHTNETTFVTGETLLYKLYCINANSKQVSKISQVAYVEIIDQAGKAISRNKIALHNGIGNNEIFITTNFNTGNYKLIAYTNWMLNNTSSKYFETNIAIINPFLPTNNKQISTDEISTLETPKTTNNDKKSNAISINIPKKAFTKREKIQLELITNSEKCIDGNFSLSVRKIDNLTFNKATSSIDFINNNKIDKFINQSNINNLPELRGELLSGKIITNDTNKTINDKHISLSLTGMPFDVKIVKTNENGEFHFILDSDVSKSEGILQILENDLNDYRITINSPSKIEFNTTSLKSDLHFTKKSITAIEERLVACQIVNAYSSKDSLITKPLKFIPFYNYSAKEYILDDYKRFPTFKETIIEIIPAVFFKEKEGNYTLHLRDFVTAGESFGNALVLVDGLLLQDVNELFNYNTKNIYKISVVNKAYSYGSKIFSGVISIATFSQEYTPKSKNILPLKMERCDATRSYQPMTYDSEIDFSRFPDYRYQLAWETNLNLSKKNTSLHFYTSDIEGKFEICLEGFSLNGEPISIKEYFEVN